MNSKKFEIKSGVPIPPRGRGRGAKYRYPWDQMKVGDSFDSGRKPPKKGKAVSLALNGTTWAKTRGKNWKFAQRTVNGSMHVWRIK